MKPASSADVAVIGCGVIGAAIAWRLSQLGMHVVSIDPAPGDGATHAAAGMLAAVSESDFGEHDLTRMNVEAAKAWPAFAAELEAESGRSTGLRRCGTLTVAYDNGDRAQLRRLLDLRRQWGLDVEEITVDTARRTTPLLGPRIAGAIWAANDHQADPRQVHRALLAALEVRRVEIVRRRAVGLSRAPDGRVTGVADDSGSRHPAGTVVLAAGWASRDLVRDLPMAAVPTRPVKGQVLRLDSSGHPDFTLDHVVRGFVQSRSIYLVPRADGEIVVGATSEEQPDDRIVTAGAVFALLRDARAMIPGLDELPLIEATARARPGSPDNLPLVGASAVDGLVVATGHYRNGILLAPATAAAVTELISAGSIPTSAADPRRFGRDPTPSTPSGGRI